MTKRGVIYIDSFSGAASDLKRGQRTPENVLTALRRDPRISTWDMCEHPWLRDCISELKSRKLIVEDKSEPYPWLRFSVVASKPEAAS